jgi:hypothetical protein
MKLVPSRDDRLRYRRAMADALAQTSTKLHDYKDYVGVAHLPGERNQARWGYGRSSNPALEAIVAAGADAYGPWVSTFAGFADEVSRVRRGGADPGEPTTHNNWIPGGDALALYGLARTLAPARYVEVGSGISTLWIHRARRDGGTQTKITSIDPYPRADVDAVCDKVVRSPLESVDLSVFAQVAAGDMVFVDNSHLALLNSDVTTFFFDVLPTLPAGVVVGIHDIYLPDDYPSEWGDYYFSEQYVLAGLLLGGQDWWEPVYAAWWVANQRSLYAPLDPVWALPNMEGVVRHGTSFWFKTKGGLVRSPR